MTADMIDGAMLVLALFAFVLGLVAAAVVW